MNNKDLHQFFHDFGLGAKKAQGDVEENDAATRAFFAQGFERVVYCMGCGQPLMSGGKTPGESRRAEGERNLKMHYKCYEDAIKEMNHLNRQVDYDDE